MSKTAIRNLIISLSLLLVAGGALAIIVMSVISQGVKLEDQVMFLAEEKKQQDVQKKLFEIAESSKNDRQKLKEYFLAKESSSIDFLNDIERLAPEVGVELSTQGLDTVKGIKDGPEWIEIDFSFSGPKDRVQNFIKILETVPYVSQVTSLDLDAQSSLLWKADATIQVQILNYDK